jgi:hypothetical protein
MMLLAAEESAFLRLFDRLPQFCQVALDAAARNRHFSCRTAFTGTQRRRDDRRGQHGERRLNDAIERRVGQRFALDAQRHQPRPERLLTRLRVFRQAQRSSAGIDDHTEGAAMDASQF